MVAEIGCGDLAEGHGRPLRQLHLLFENTRGAEGPSDVVEPDLPPVLRRRVKDAFEQLRRAPPQGDGGDCSDVFANDISRRGEAEITQSSTARNRDNVTS